MNLRIGSLALAAILLPAAVHAEGAPADSGVVAEASALSWGVTCASKYSFQGIDYSAGRTVAQPQLGYARHAWSIALWGNLDQARSVLNELDTSVSREWKLGRCSGGAGYQNLQYFHRPDWQPTHELFGSLAVDGALQPSFAVHWDVAAGGGAYWTAGLERDLTWGATTLGLTSRLYAQEHYYGLTGIPSAEGGFTLSRALARQPAQLSVTHHWTWANGDFRGANATRDDWVVALTVGAR